MPGQKKKNLRLESSSIGHYVETLTADINEILSQLFQNQTSLND